MTTLEPFEAAAMIVLMIGSFLCLYRISRGPTAPDRTVAIDILGFIERITDKDFRGAYDIIADANLLPPI